MVLGKLPVPGRPTITSMVVLSKRYFRFDCICFMFGAVYFLNLLNVSILTLLCVQFMKFS